MLAKLGVNRHGVGVGLTYLTSWVETNQDRCFQVMETDDPALLQSLQEVVLILLPSLNRAREQSNKVKCLANLRTVGHALFMYSDQHKGRLPNSNPFQTTDAAAPRPQNTA
mgnify:CR=1 FL=1